MTARARFRPYEDDLETLHQIIEEADSSDEAWDETIQYAEQQ